MFSTRAHAVPWIEQADIGLPWHATVRRQWIWECSTELVDGRRRSRVGRSMYMAEPTTLLYGVRRLSRRRVMILYE